MTEATVAVADVTAEPTVRAFPRGWDGKPQRSISYDWLVRTDEDGHRLVVQLYCFHTRGRYATSLNNERQEDNGISTSLPFSALRSLAAEPCARYSKSEFEAFAARALADLRSKAETDAVAPYLRGEHGPDR